MYYSGEGVYPTLSLTGIHDEGEREIILDAEDSGIIFNTPAFTADFKKFAFTGSTPYDPVNIYTWDGKLDCC